VGRSTRGHRLAADTAFSFTDSASWLEGLRQRAVIADVAERRARIQAGLDELTDALGADRIDDPALLDEVQHLVEVPVVMEGAFDEELLDLPPRLLVTSMKVHQRYFPIFESGLLTNRFAIVSNNPWADAALVAEGNARVLRARFHDARFFLAEDRKRPLDAFTAALSKMRWINGLGTMADKQVRVSALAPALVVRLAGEAEEVAALAGIAGRAGMLCKADLATQMVGEFPELQGHMGRLYAAHAGEGDAVARAIEDHYRPAFAGDAVPTALPSVALALADRLDTLVGCFGIGMVPKGSGDPQGLRRAAAGVLALLQDNGLRVPLPDLFRRAIEVFQFTLVDSVLPRGDRLAFDAWIAARGEGPHARDMDALVDELVAFTVARFKAAAVADGATADRVDAVLAVSEADPILLRARLDALERVAGTDAFAPILNTFKRVLNISAGQHAPAPDPSSMTEPAERDLAHAVAAARDEVSRASARLDFDAALAAMLRLEQPIAAFFDAVLVDDPDPARKAVRVGLLLEVASLFHTVADFTRVSSR
jgi:glycyl-tRNA synthetase beta chain